MTAAILGFFSSRLGTAVATAAAILFAAGFFWQSVRIDGWPLVGGGLKAQIAQLQGRAAADALAHASSEAAALAAQAKAAAAANEEARAHAVAAAANARQIRTVIEKVPVYVSEKSDTGCVVPWGAVRLLDAAASGTGPDFARAHVAPGQPDDAASDVTLSEAVALLAADLGAARDNEDQLRHLENAVRTVRGQE
jgi:hypothetical protein